MIHIWTLTLQLSFFAGYPLLTLVMLSKLEQLWLISRAAHSVRFAKKISYDRGGIKRKKLSCWKNSEIRTFIIRKKWENWGIHTARRWGGVSEFRSFSKVNSFFYLLLFFLQSIHWKSFYSDSFHFRCFRQTCVMCRRSMGWNEKVECPCQSVQWLCSVSFSLQSNLDVVPK